MTQAARRDIAFPGHDGTTLRGWLYTAEGGGKQPGVAMMHGFSATKDMALDSYAEVFAAAGLNVLVYDHRGFGESDGAPRQLIDPWVQARDLLVAIDWLAQQQGVDPQRLGVWGSSYAGGLALIAGALAPGVKAVVANVPFVGAPSQLQPDSFTRLTAGVRNAKINTEGMIGPLAVVKEPGDQRHAVMPQDDAAEWFLAAGRATGARWRNEVWMADPARNADYNPAAALAHLQGPALFVVAEADLQASPDAARAAHALAPKSSELLMVAGHHFLPYVGEGVVQSSAAARDFFVKRL